MNTNMNTGTMNSSMNHSIDASWDDQRMINDLLSTEKQLAGEYGMQIIEGSTQQFRDVLTQNHRDTLQDQFKVYQQMEQRGWYPLKPAPQPEIQTAKQKFMAMKNQLM